MKDEPAFPEIRGHLTTPDDTPGLTKLEWFAGMALQGLSSNPDPQLLKAEPAKLSAWAFDAAEAMCAEAAKRKAGK